MNIKDLNSIWDRFEQSCVSDFHIKTSEFELSLKKGGSAEAFVSEPKAFEKAETKPALAVSSLSENTFPVTSPLAGTFYRAASPDDEPFVKSGQRVEAGQVVGLVEAMKMINEIKAPAAGIVRSIEAQNGQLVGFEQTLIILEKADV